MERDPSRPRALVVYESMFGNTAAVARAIGDGLRPRFDAVDVVDVTAAPSRARCLRPRRRRRPDARLRTEPAGHSSQRPRAGRRRGRSRRAGVARRGRRAGVAGTGGGIVRHAPEVPVPDGLRGARHPPPPPTPRLPGRRDGELHGDGHRGSAGARRARRSPSLRVVDPGAVAVVDNRGDRVRRDASRRREGTRHVTIVPAEDPATSRTCHRAAPARSAMFRSPCPSGRVAAARPTPSSCTRTSTSPAADTSTSTAVAWACRATLLSASRRVATSSSPMRAGTVVSIGPSSITRGSKPRAAAASRTVGEHWRARRPRGDRCCSRPKMAVRMSLIVTSRSSTACSIRADRRVGVRAHQPRRALQRHAGGEQALDHGVVEVAGDALAVLGEGERRAPARDSRAFSMATPAAPARPTTSSSSTSVKTSPSACR